MALWFPTVDRVLRIHERILEESGGETGVLNRGPIESAIVRAREGPFPGGDPSLWRRAAFLLRGIVQDHPFVDGNKRTAYEVASLFLRKNNISLEPSMEEARDLMIAVARGQRTVQAITRWLRRNSRNV